MKRCLVPLAPLAVALTLAGAAHAQSLQRPFPKDALRGTLTVKQPPYIEMDDRVTRLAPGARVLDTDNRAVRPSALTHRELTVNYVMDRRGQVTQAWILTDQEKREKRRTLGVERNYSFASDQPAGPGAAPPALPAPSH